MQLSQIAFVHNIAMTPNTLDIELIQLLDRVAARDPTALKALYDRSAGKLYGLALRVVTQREHAEDVLQ